MVATVMRWLTPAGFLLAVVLFLFLPFAAASCDVPADPGTAAGRLGVSMSGADLAASHEHLDASGGLALAPAEQTRADLLVRMPRRTQILALLTVVVLLGGLVPALVRPVRVRAATAAALAGVAGVLLAVTEYVVLRRLTTFARSFLLYGAYLPSVRGRNLNDRVGEVVHTGVGFWSSLAVVLALAVTNIAVVVRGR
jgi:hypothetical protein